MSRSHARSVRIAGRGRAGGSFAAALDAVGWHVDLVGGDALRGPNDDVDVVLLCVPDPVVADVAASLRIDDRTVLAHCAGSLGLDVLGPAERRASVHPLVALPDAALGARRLRGAWFAVAGDSMATEVVDALDGHPVEVPDERRVLHHAAAVIASNHLVALMGQVQRVAALAEVPLEAYLDLASGALENTIELGPAEALTGPVRRGDWDTVVRHLDALPDAERPAYDALARAAARLVADG